MNRVTTFFAAILLILLMATPALAQKAATNQPVATDNGYIDVLQALNDIDFDGMQDFFTNMEQHLDGTNIFELGSMKDLAVKILPVLDQYEETSPYAVWLRAHLDDFDTAKELQREMNLPGQTTVPPTNAVRRMATLQRSIWVKELRREPLPPLAKKYLPSLKRIFIEEKMPPELAWVAGVESSFDSRARSPAGAAGMFQLMPATARDQHLSLWPFDQRYQPEKSARAAARYLRTLYGHYGNWPLALAAYNVGLGRVDKLLQEHQAHSFEGIARWLPAETQMYVPKLEATLLEREGRSLADLKIPHA